MGNGVHFMEGVLQQMRRERDEARAALTDAQVQLESIRRHLGGHKDSVLDGSNGLAQATYSAMRREEIRADENEALAEKLRARAESAEAEVARRGEALAAISDRYEHDEDLCHTEDWIAVAEGYRWCAETARRALAQQGGRDGE